jgi:hypothetical protein
MVDADDLKPSIGSALHARLGILEGYSAVYPELRSDAEIGRRIRLMALDVLSKHHCFKAITNAGVAEQGLNRAPF